MAMVEGTLWTIQGGETAKECGDCGTVWKNSWLFNNQPFNTCPFCGAIFKVGSKIRRNKPKQRKMHWKLQESIKFLCRLGGSLHNIDWRLFNNDTYTTLLQKRPSLIEKFNNVLEELLGKLHKK